MINRWERFKRYFNAPTKQQPHGAFRNNSSFDADDGSILDASWINDWSAFFSSIIVSANIIPDGYVDEVGKSQIYDALLQVIKRTSQAEPGTVQTFAQKTPPDGWLLADGRELKQTQYKDLFGAIGRQYGGTDSTFRIPDLRGVFVRGLDNGRGITNNALGSLQNDSIAAHTHGIMSATEGDEESDFAWPMVTHAYGSIETVRTMAQLRPGDETRPVNTALVYAIKY